MMGHRAELPAERTARFRVWRAYPRIGGSRDAPAGTAQVGAEDAVALSPTGDSAQSAYPHHPGSVVATLANAPFRCQVRGRATSSASRARVYARWRAAGAEHAAIGEPARSPAEASAHAALFARQRIPGIAVRAYRPVREIDPPADCGFRAARALKWSIQVSAVATDPAGGTDCGQRFAALAIRTGWRPHRSVAVRNEHMRQTHYAAWTGRVRVEDTVTASSQIRIDLIERFRTVHTSSFQEAVGICER